jgi:methoxymalonate biosynthesis acyl carrier protein
VNRRVTADTIRRYINEELANASVREVISDDYPILDRQVLDSLGLFQLVGFLESQFGVVVRDEELVPANFGTVQDIANLVDAKIASS